MTYSTVLDTRTQVLEASRELLQSRGFNAFSHRDLAVRVGIKSSSIHYHFPTKEDVGVALLRAYRLDMQALFKDLESVPTPKARLARFCGLFEQTARSGDKLCLAGMLASDFQTLGEELKAELRVFFMLVETWLAQQARLARPTRSARQSAALGKLAFAALEGALLAARVFAEPARVSQASTAILGLFESKQDSRSAA
jgi:TetR/AcrR family transcriptional regulator, transcriptional repressor for nem operon